MTQHTDERTSERVGCSHAPRRRAGLRIDHVPGRRGALPVIDSSFDLAQGCDVLEHVDDVGAVFSEVRRAPTTDGLFVYDTINRRPVSRLVLLKLFQWDAPVSSGLGSTSTPSSSNRGSSSGRCSASSRAGVSAKPPGKPLTLARLLRDRWCGEISTPELAARTKLWLSHERSGTFVGHARTGGGR